MVVGDHNGHVGLGVKCAKEVWPFVALITRNPELLPVGSMLQNHTLG